MCRSASNKHAFLSVHEILSCPICICQQESDRDRGQSTDGLPDEDFPDEGIDVEYLQRLRERQSGDCSFAAKTYAFPVGMLCSRVKALCPIFLQVLMVPVAYGEHSVLIMSSMTALVTCAMRRGCNPP